MLAASLFGLVDEGLAEGTPGEIGIGMLAGVALVVLAHDVLMDAEIDPQEYEEADFKKLVLILGVLTVHSFPEGIAVGVSFADLGLEGGTQLFGFTVPLLAVFMTLAISIHNVPEGTAISIPLRSMGVSKWKMVWWSVFSSLPQPIGAVVAFAFVRYAREFLPYGFGLRRRRDDLSRGVRVHPRGARNRGRSSRRRQAGTRRRDRARRPVDGSSQLHLTPDRSPIAAANT